VIPLPGFSDTNLPVLMLLETELLFPSLSTAPAEDLELDLPWGLESAEPLTEVEFDFFPAVTKLIVVVFLAI
jgi:hypothetical protein